MFEINQIAIVAAITVTTVIFTIVGIQLILILKDVRSIVKKANTISTQLEQFGLNISSGYTELIGFMVGVKKLVNVLDLLTDKHAKRAKK